MTSENKLSLEEMLQLTEKMDTWTLDKEEHLVIGTYQGNLNPIVTIIKINRGDLYKIRVNMNGVIIGEEKREYGQENCHKIQAAYEDKLKIAEERKKVKQKEGIEFIRSFLKK